MAYSRRTHVVRVYNTDSGVVGVNPTDGKTAYQTYFDVEVLDAISFRNVRNEEMVMNFDAMKAVPFVTDNTGDGNAQTPSGTDATRRSHMKQITGLYQGQPVSSAFFDIEMLDAVAARDANGNEWIINFPSDGNTPPDVYDSTDGSGSPGSTRRVHDETIQPPSQHGPGGLIKPPKTTYITVQRCDTIAFRRENGKEMVIVCPSSDDNSGSGRASTFVTPAGYDSTADPTDPRTVVPPTNTDPNIYIAFPKPKTVHFPATTKSVPTSFWYYYTTHPGYPYWSQANQLSDPPPGPIFGSLFAAFQGLPAGNTQNPFPAPGYLNSDGTGNSLIGVVIGYGTVDVTTTVPAYDEVIGGAIVTQDTKIAQGPLWWIRNMSGSVEF